jgi:5-methylthioadenosine/S-adenosylhomocysteine deaminase
MTKTILKTQAIVTMDPARRVLYGGAIVVHGTTIERVLTAEALATEPPVAGEILNAPYLVAIPGFVQTHIHLCQTLFRGLADDMHLLDWLTLRIFPFEAAHTAPSMRASALLGIAELIRSGTTTIMDMGSVHHEEEIVRAIAESGLRAFVGKAMMDVNELYPPLHETTEEALASVLQQAEQWHGSSAGRVRYAVAPRFVLSCSDSLLREAYQMTASFPGMLFHTHAAENRNELEAVRKRCGMDNVEFFESLGILRGNTCLAHCVWLNERDEELIATRQAKVLHCPSSNLKLGSGIARIPDLIARGVTVSLGADGAPCNNSLDMFHEMRLASLIQKPAHGATAMDARTVFACATLGGATALGIEREIGSIEPGKKADLVLLALNEVWNPSARRSDDDLYSAIVYSGRAENVRSVMIDGQWVYDDGHPLTLDEQQIAENGRMQARLLLDRMESR